MAVNKYGDGDAGLSPAFTAQHTCQPPTRVPQPRIEMSKQSPRSCVIKWQEPESDGGSEIVGYRVQRRYSNISARWLTMPVSGGGAAPVNDDEALIDKNTKEFVVQNLMSNMDYEFRVVAVNRAGLESEPSEPTSILRVPQTPQAEVKDRFGFGSTSTKTTTLEEEEKLVSESSERTSSIAADGTRRPRGSLIDETTRQNKQEEERTEQLLEAARSQRRRHSKTRLGVAAADDQDDDLSRASSITTRTYEEKSTTEQHETTTKKSSTRQSRRDQQHGTVNGDENENTDDNNKQLALRTFDDAAAMSTDGDGHTLTMRSVSTRRTVENDGSGVTFSTDETMKSITNLGGGAILLTAGKKMTSRGAYGAPQMNISDDEEFSQHDLLSSASGRDSAGRARGGGVGRDGRSAGGGASRTSMYESAVTQDEEQIDYRRNISFTGGNEFDFEISSQIHDFIQFPRGNSRRQQQDRRLGQNDGDDEEEISYSDKLRKRIEMTEQFDNEYKTLQREQSASRPMSPTGSPFSPFGAQRQFEIEKGRTLRIKVSYFNTEDDSTAPTSPGAQQPPPNATWSRVVNNNEEAQHVQEELSRDQSERVFYKIEHDALSGANETTLLIRDAQPRLDAGKYTLKLSAAAPGESAMPTENVAEYDIQVVVHDVPEAPENLRLVDKTNESVKLDWRHESLTTPLENRPGVRSPTPTPTTGVISFSVDKKLSDATLWQVVGSCAAPPFEVRNLFEDEHYTFRVRAENLVGMSEPCVLTKPVKICWPFSPPGACAAPRVQILSKSTAQVLWLPPDDMGGDVLGIAGYHVERRCTTSSRRWMKITREVLRHESLVCDDLVDGYEYEFRIIATNRAGESAPSESAKIRMNAEDAAPASSAPTTAQQTPTKTTDDVVDRRAQTATSASASVREESAREFSARAEEEEKAQEKKPARLRGEELERKFTEFVEKHQVPSDNEEENEDDDELMAVSTASRSEISESAMLRTYASSVGRNVSVVSGRTEDDVMSQYSTRTLLADAAATPTQSLTPTPTPAARTPEKQERGASPATAVEKTADSKESVQIKRSAQLAQNLETDASHRTTISPPQYVRAQSTSELSSSPQNGEAAASAGEEEKIKISWQPAEKSEKNDAAAPPSTYIVEALVGVDERTGEQQWTQIASTQENFVYVDDKQFDEKLNKKSTKTTTRRGFNVGGRKNSDEIEEQQEEEKEKEERIFRVRTVTADGLQSSEAIEARHYDADADAEEEEDVVTVTDTARVVDDEETPHVDEKKRRRRIQTADVDDELDRQQQETNKDEKLQQPVLSIKHAQQIETTSNTVHIAVDIGHQQQSTSKSTTKKDDDSNKRKFIIEAAVAVKDKKFPDRQQALLKADEQQQDWKPIYEASNIIPNDDKTVEVDVKIPTNILPPQKTGKGEPVQLLLRVRSVTADDSTEENKPSDIKIVDFKPQTKNAEVVEAVLDKTANTITINWQEAEEIIKKEQQKSAAQPKSWREQRAQTQPETKFFDVKARKIDDSGEEFKIISKNVEGSSFKLNVEELLEKLGIEAESAAVEFQIVPQEQKSTSTTQSAKVKTFESNTLSVALPTESAEKSAKSQPLPTPKIREARQQQDSEDAGKIHVEWEASPAHTAPGDESAGPAEVNVKFYVEAAIEENVRTSSKETVELEWHVVHESEHNVRAASQIFEADIDLHEALSALPTAATATTKNEAPENVLLRVRAVETTATNERTAETKTAVSTVSDTERVQLTPTPTPAKLEELDTRTPTSAPEKKPTPTKITEIGALDETLPQPKILEAQQISDDDDTKFHLAWQITPEKPTQSRYRQPKDVPESSKSLKYIVEAAVVPKEATRREKLAAEWKVVHETETLQQKSPLEADVDVREILSQAKSVTTSVREEQQTLMFRVTSVNEESGKTKHGQASEVESVDVKPAPRAEEKEKISAEKTSLHNTTEEIHQHGIVEKSLPQPEITEAKQILSSSEEGVDNEMKFHLAWQITPEKPTQARYRQQKEENKPLKYVVEAAVVPKDAGIRERLAAEWKVVHETETQSKQQQQQKSTLEADVDMSEFLAKSVTTSVREEQQTLMFRVTSINDEETGKIKHSEPSKVERIDVKPAPRTEERKSVPEKNPLHTTEEIHQQGVVEKSLPQPEITEAKQISNDNDETKFHLAWQITPEKPTQARFRQKEEENKPLKYVVEAAVVPKDAGIRERLAAEWKVVHETETQQQQKSTLEADVDITELLAKSVTTSVREEQQTLMFRVTSVKDEETGKIKHSEPSKIAHVDVAPAPAASEKTNKTTTRPEEEKKANEDAPHIRTAKLVEEEASSPETIHVAWDAPAAVSAPLKPSKYIVEVAERTTTTKTEEKSLDWKKVYETDAPPRSRRTSTASAPLEADIPLEEIVNVIKKRETSVERITTKKLVQEDEQQILMRVRSVDARGNTLGTPSESVPVETPKTTTAAAAEEKEEEEEEEKPVSATLSADESTVQISWPEDTFEKAAGDGAAKKGTSFGSKTTEKFDINAKKQTSSKKSTTEEREQEFHNIAKNVEGHSFDMPVEKLLEKLSTDGEHGTIHGGDEDNEAEKIIFQVAPAAESATTTRRRRSQQAEEKPQPIESNAIDVPSTPATESAVARDGKQIQAQAVDSEHIRVQWNANQEKIVEQKTAKFIIEAAAADEEGGAVEWQPVHTTENAKIREATVDVSEIVSQQQTPTLHTAAAVAAADADVTEQQQVAPPVLLVRVQPVDAEEKPIGKPSAAKSVQMPSVTHEKDDIIEKSPQTVVEAHQVEEQPGVVHVAWETSAKSTTSTATEKSSSKTTTKYIVEAAMVESTNKDTTQQKKPTPTDEDNTSEKPEWKLVYEIEDTQRQSHTLETDIVLKDLFPEKSIDQENKLNANKKPTELLVRVRSIEEHSNNKNVEHMSEITHVPLSHASEETQPEKSDDKIAPAAAKKRPSLVEGADDKTLPKPVISKAQQIDDSDKFEIAWTVPAPDVPGRTGRLRYSGQQQQATQQKQISKFIIEAAVMPEKSEKSRRNSDEKELEWNIVHETSDAVVHPEMEARIDVNNLLSERATKEKQVLLLRIRSIDAQGAHGPASEIMKIPVEARLDDDKEEEELAATTAAEQPAAAVTATVNTTDDTVKISWDTQAFTDTAAPAGKKPTDFGSHEKFDIKAKTVVRRENGQRIDDEEFKTIAKSVEGSSYELPLEELREKFAKDQQLGTVDEQFAKEIIFQVTPAEKPKEKRSRFLKQPETLDEKPITLESNAIPVPTPTPAKKADDTKQPEKPTPTLVTATLNEDTNTVDINWQAAAADAQNVNALQTLKGSATKAGQMSTKTTNQFEIKAKMLTSSNKKQDESEYQLLDKAAAGTSYSIPVDELMEKLARQVVDEGNDRPIQVVFEITPVVSPATKVAGKISEGKKYESNVLDLVTSVSAKTKDLVEKTEATPEKAEKPIFTKKPSAFTMADVEAVADAAAPMHTNKIKASLNDVGDTVTLDWQEAAAAAADDSSATSLKSRKTNFLASERLKFDIEAKHVSSGQGEDAAENQPFTKIKSSVVAGDTHTTSLAVADILSALPKNVAAGETDEKVAHVKFRFLSTEQKTAGQVLDSNILDIPILLTTPTPVAPPPTPTKIIIRSAHQIPTAQKPTVQIQWDTVQRRASSAEEKDEEKKINKFLIEAVLLSADAAATVEDETEWKVCMETAAHEANIELEKSFPQLIRARQPIAGQFLLVRVRGVNKTGRTVTTQATSDTERIELKDFTAQRRRSSAASVKSEILDAAAALAPLVVAALNATQDKVTVDWDAVRQALDARAPKFGAPPKFLFDLKVRVYKEGGRRGGTTEDEEFKTIKKSMEACTYNMFVEELVALVADFLSDDDTFAPLIFRVSTVPSTTSTAYRRPSVEQENFDSNVLDVPIPKIIVTKPEQIGADEVGEPRRPLAPPGRPKASILQTGATQLAWTDDAASDDDKAQQNLKAGKKPAKNFGQRLYKIQVRKSGKKSDDWKETGTTSDGSLQKILTGLEVGEMYEARVVAVVEKEESLPSEASPAFKFSAEAAAPAATPDETEIDSNLPKLAYAGTVPDDGNLIFEIDSTAEGVEKLLQNANIFVRPVGTDDGSGENVAPWQKLDDTVAAKLLEKISPLQQKSKTNFKRKLIIGKKLAGGSYEAALAIRNENDFGKEIRLTGPVSNVFSVPSYEPSMPRNLSVRRSSTATAAAAELVVEWQAPDSDGRAPIEKYEIQYLRKEAAAAAQQPQPRLLSRDKQQTLTTKDKKIVIKIAKDALDSAEAEISVVAINKFGRSEPATEKFLSSGADDADIVEKPIVNVSNGKVDAEWKLTPATKIEPLGYHVEICQKTPSASSPTKWKRLTKSLVKQTRYVLSNSDLAELDDAGVGAELQIRVIPVLPSNTEGKPSEPSAPFTVPATTTSRRPSEDTDAAASLVTKPIVNVLDSGDAEVTWQPTAAAAAVTSAGAEDKPLTNKFGPMVRRRSSTASVEGGVNNNKIAGYHVETRQLSKGDGGKWKRVTKSLLTENKFVVTDLTEQTEYEVHVIPVLASPTGKESKPSEPSAPFTIPARKPSAKTSTEAVEAGLLVEQPVVKVLENGRDAHVSWRPAAGTVLVPESPSKSSSRFGSTARRRSSATASVTNKVAGFYVEVQQVGVGVDTKRPGKWRRVTKTLVRQNEFVISDLEAGNDYQVRIVPVQCDDDGKLLPSGGEAKPSEPSATFTIPATTKPPSSAGATEAAETGLLVEKPTVKVQDNGEADVSWSPAPGITVDESPASSKPSRFLSTRRPSATDTKKSSNVLDGYHVEVREATVKSNISGTRKQESVVWRRVTKTLLKHAQYAITDLEENREYEVRIVPIRNETDCKPSEVSAPFVITRRKLSQKDGTEGVEASLFVERPKVEPGSDEDALASWKLKRPSQHPDVANVIGYHVELLDVTKKGSWRRLTKTAIKDMQFLLKQLELGTEFQIRIVPVLKSKDNKSVEGLPSEPSATFTIYPKGRPPKKDTEAAEAALFIERPSVEVNHEAANALASWKINTETKKKIDGYHVEVHKTRQQSWRRVTKSLVTETKFLLTTLDLDEEYEIRVIPIISKAPAGDSKSVPKTEEGEPSEPSAAFTISSKKPVSAATEAANAALYVEKPTVKVFEKTEEAEVSWTLNKKLLRQTPGSGSGSKPLNIGGYHIELREKNNSTSWRRMTKLWVRQTTYTLTQLKRDIVYEVRIVPVDNDRTTEGAPSEPSEPFIIRTVQAEVPSKEQNLYANVLTDEAPICSSAGANNVRLDWHEPNFDNLAPREVGYEVEYREVAPVKSLKWRRATRVRTTATNFVVKSLEPRHTYEFRIVKQFISSNEREEQSVTTKTSLPFTVGPALTPVLLQPPSMSEKLSDINEHPNEEEDRTVGSDMEMDEAEELPTDDTLGREGDAKLPTEQKGLAGQKPEITVTTRIVRVKEGERATLSCQVRGAPTPSVTWFNASDGEVLHDTDEHRYIADTRTNTYQLLFRNAFIEHAGMYNVVARNVYGKATQEVQLKITKSSDAVEKDDGGPRGERKPSLPREAPSFVHGLPEKVNLTETDDLELTVQYAGEPPPNIKWLRNGKYLTYSHRTTITKDVKTCQSILRVLNVTAYDAGTYSVEAENVVGKATSSTQVLVKPSEKPVTPQDDSDAGPPAFERVFDDVTAVEESDVVFEIRLRRTRKQELDTEVDWYINGQLIRDTLDLSSFRTIFDVNNSGTYGIKLKNLKQHMSGRIEVRVRNRYGSASHQAYLNVVKKTLQTHEDVSESRSPTVRPPRFVRQLRDTRITEGSSCTMECKIETEVLREVLRKTTTSKTTFSSSTSYRVRWLRNQAEIHTSSSEEEENSKFIATQHATGDAGIELLRLKISNATLDDAANITCEVTNSAGKATTSADLIVLSSSNEKTKVSGEKPITRGPPWPITTPPTIVTDLGDEVHMKWDASVTPDDSPMSPLTYIVEGQQVGSKNWHALRRHMIVRHVRLTGLTINVNYRFRIRVENSFGVSDASPVAETQRTVKNDDDDDEDRGSRPAEFQMPTRQKSHAEAPHFLTDNNSTIYGVAGESIALEARSYGYPNPELNWSYRGNNIDSTKDRYIVRPGAAPVGSTSTLVVNKLEQGDAGTYTCTARNESGEAQLNIKLIIAEPPVFLDSMIDGTFLVNSRARLDCRVDGLPYPDIKWYKDWRPLTNHDRVNIIFTAPDRCTLLFHNVMHSDGGLYTCEAKNVAGSALCTVKVKVETDKLKLDRAARAKEASNGALPARNIQPKRRQFTNFYELQQEIGRGVQGVVKKAMEYTSGYAYAVKITFRDETRLVHEKLVDNEYKALNAVQEHPNIVGLHDVYHGPNYEILVMDLIRGGDVLTRLSQLETYTEDTVRQISRQILDAFVHIHSRNVAYLDLKPQDVLFVDAASDTIKLADFGNAQQLPDSGFLPQWNFGSPEFSAPEIVAGIERVGRPADLWSLGVVIYTLLTGVSPFLGKNDRETLQNVVSPSGVSYAALDSLPNISDECKQFVRSLLVRAPDVRPAAEQARKHAWFGLKNELLEKTRLETKTIRQYWRHSQTRIAREQVVHFDRRRPLNDAMRHPQGLLYTPSAATPRDEHLLNALAAQAMLLGPDGSPLPPRTGTPRDYLSPRPDSSLADDLNSAYLPHFMGSESSYQQGPETDVIQLKDPDYVTRIRSYQRISSDASVSWRLKAERKMTSVKPAVKERRRMLDVADEEGTNAALARFAALKRQWRHQQTVTTTTTTVDNKTIVVEKSGDEEGCAPFFREKLPGSAAFQENKPFALRAVVIGTPAPNISWYHNELLIGSGGDGGRIRISSNIPTAPAAAAGSGDAGQVILFIDKTWAGDAGEYKCIARNEFGEAITRAVVNIGAVPDAPAPPQPTWIAPGQVMLHWLPPLFDGNSEIFAYKLESRSQHDTAWTLVADNLVGLSVHVTDLVLGQAYRFRVAAANALGWGAFSHTSEEFITSRMDSMISTPQTPSATQQQQRQRKMSVNVAADVDEMNDIASLTHPPPPHDADGEPPMSPTTKSHGDYRYKLRGLEKISVNLEKSTLSPSAALDELDVLHEIRRTRRERLLRCKRIDRINDNNEIVLVKMTTTVDGAERLREFEALRSLKHANILELLDATLFSSSSLLMLTFENVTPCDVLTYLCIKDLYNEEEVSNIIRQVLDALQYLHYLGLTHLNVRPENVLTTSMSNFHAKLVNFEHSRRIPTSAEGVLNLPQGGAGDEIAAEFTVDDFTAPEIIYDRQIWFQSDLWSVGALTFLLLSGTPPFYDPTDQEETLLNIQFCRYNIRHLYSGLSIEAIRFIMQTLRTDPRFRLTADECLEHHWIVPTEIGVRKRSKTTHHTWKLRGYQAMYLAKLEEEQNKSGGISNGIADR